MQFDFKKYYSLAGILAGIFAFTVLHYLGSILLGVLAYLEGLILFLALLSTAGGIFYAVKKCGMSDSKDSVTVSDCFKVAMGTIVVGLCAAGCFTIFTAASALAVAYFGGAFVIALFAMAFYLAP